MSPLKVTVEDDDNGQITIIAGGIIRTFHTGPREVVTAVDEVQELAREGVAGATARAFNGKDDVAAAAAEPARPRRFACTECGRPLSESRAIEGYNCPEHVDHVLMRARTAHDAYARATGHMPNSAGVDFDRLTDKQRAAWRAAAAAVIEDVSG